MDDQSITLEQLFNAPAVKVWQAITVVTEMKLWYFDLPAIIAEVGCKFQFTGGPSPEKQYVHLCEIQCKKLFELIYKYNIGTLTTYKNQKKVRI